MRSPYGESNADNGIPGLADQRRAFLDAPAALIGALNRQFGHLLDRAQLLAHLAGRGLGALR